LGDRGKNYLVGVGLLLLLFALLISGARFISITADEPSHLASGYAFLARWVDGLWTMPERGHPLLVDAWLALPTFIARPDVSLESLPGWRANYGMFVSSFRDDLQSPEGSVFAGRVLEMLLTTLLAAVVYRWATDLWGQRAGWLALGVLVFDPTLLAHGRLATNDMGVVMLGTLTLYAAWRWWRQGGWRSAIGLGVLLAATMLAKQSGILWAAAFGGGTLWMGLTRRRSWSFWGQAVVAGTIALLLLWATYGFTFGEVPHLPISFPAPAHWQGVFRHERRSANRQVFALGMRKRGHWWWYFPLAFAIKNPLPLLLGIGISVVVLARRSLSRRSLVALGLFPGLYVAVAMVVGMNIGYRHMLPLHPFLYLIAGGGLEQWGWGGRSRPLWKWGLVILGAWYVAATVRIFPYEIAYFNEWVGGPEGGYRYLADSNLDWGQSTQVRDAYLDAHPGVQIEPPATAFRPSPGRYLVGASALQGLGVSEPDAYEWFRHWEPADVLNYSQLLYDVPPFEMTWIAQCENPRAPLDRASIVEGTGRDDLRVVQLDCTQAWLYPSGGVEPGMYALHHDLVDEPGLCLPSFLPCPTVPAGPFTARHLAQARFSFEQAYDSQLPAFCLYEVLPSDWRFQPTVYADLQGISPAMLGASERLSAPVALEGALAFLNAAAYRGEDLLEVETWWLVVDAPISRPFSIMGQLVSSDGETIGGFDKLGVSPLTLATGDVLVQRHLFSKPPEGTELWLRTGAYWLDKMERWPVSGVAGSDALLTPLEVE
jgi:hypothetical protein